MGSRHVTTYYCDCCRKESANPEDINCWIVANRHGGSPKTDWNVCDDCHDGIRVEIDMFIEKTRRAT